MNDATGQAEALLGLNDFRVLAVEETPSEVIVMLETADSVGCPTCSLRRRRQGPCQGRHQGSSPLRVAGTSRLIEAAVACVAPDCAPKNWTEGT
jgi:hypothetical protein